MAVVRYILALWICLSLTVTPVAVSIASPASETGMSMEHCDKAAGKTVSSHCDCCDKSKACTPGSCVAHCAKVPACLPTAVDMRFAAAPNSPRPAYAAMDQRSWPPPTPPPRV